MKFNANRIYKPLAADCNGKWELTEAAARQEAARLGDGIEAYKCRMGDHWHVGHHKKSRRSR